MTDDRPRVLVVEDEPELAEIFSIWLSEEFDVDTVTRGADALDRLGQGFDILILDWRLPDVSGEDILEEVHNTEQEAAIAVITGADPELIDVGDEVDVVLRKPVRSNELLGALEDLELRNHAGRDQ